MKKVLKDEINGTPRIELNDKSLIYAWYISASRKTSVEALILFARINKEDVLTAVIVFPRIVLADRSAKVALTVETLNELTFTTLMKYELMLLTVSELPDALPNPSVPVDALFAWRVVPDAEP